jgi:hypothetical protein
MKTTFGFFSFTEITDPAEHRAYNAWHQLDHLPEQFPLRGIVYGQRWVSTPACRAARAASDASLDPIHYLTCYLMADPIEGTLAEFFDLGTRLHELDRFHRHRRARLTGPFRVGSTVAAPRVLVSAAAVPFRAHRGLYVVVEEYRDRSAAADSQRWLAAEHEPAVLAVPGVAGIWTFETSEELTSPRWSAGARRITVCWLDDDPVAVAARLAPLEVVRQDRFDSVSHVTFAGPFETITPWEWDWFDTP